MDAETGEFIVDKDGEPVTASASFYANEEWAGDEGVTIDYEYYTKQHIESEVTTGTDEDGSDTALGWAQIVGGLTSDTITLLSGSVDVTFELDTTSVAGKDLVVYEYLYRSDAPINTDDAEDTDEGIVGSEDGPLTGPAMDEGSNEVLIGGQTITEDGEIVSLDSAAVNTDGIDKKSAPADTDNETADADKDPAAADEPIESEENGKPSGLIFLASHEDITDPNQTLHYPEIGTTATINGDKEITSDGVITLDDVVEYKNLVPGETYTVEGTVMDKATGKALLINGEEVIATGDFTPEEADGAVTVRFTFDATGLGDKELVVFEKLFSFETKAQITSHEDIDDEGQTVTLIKPPVVETNDNVPIILFAIAGGACVALVIVLIIRKKKK